MNRIIFLLFCAILMSCGSSGGSAVKEKIDATIAFDKTKLPYSGGVITLSIDNSIDTNWTGGTVVLTDSAETQTTIDITNSLSAEITLPPHDAQSSVNEKYDLLITLTNEAGMSKSHDTLFLEVEAPSRPPDPPASFLD